MTKIIGDADARKVINKRNHIQIVDLWMFIL